MEPVQAEIVGSAVAGDLGAAGGGRLRAAHRLRQPRQPAAGAGRDPAPRVRGAHRARRHPRHPAAPVHHRGHAAVARRRRRSASALAVGGLRALLALYPESLPRSADVALDPDGAGLHPWRVAADRAGLRPGAAGAHCDPGRSPTALKEGGGRGATGGGRHGVRRALVVAEVALAVVLVVGAGLMMRTILNLSSVDAGFNRSRLSTFAVDLPNANYRRLGRPGPLLPAAGRPSWRRCPASRAPPRCPACRRSATSTPTTPTSRASPRPRKARSRTWTTTRRSAPATSRRWASRSSTAAPLPATDDGGAPVAIVNETLVRTFFPDRSPIGQRAARRLQRSQSLAHHRRRRQGRQAGRRRSEDRHRAVLPTARRRSPTRSSSRRRR